MSTLTNRERKLRRLARKERRRSASIARSERALSIDCPVPQCQAKADVWCFVRRGLGPDMHERRWAASKAVA